jgi:hypothetical protein
MTDDVADRLARWAERDAAIGLAAELREARLALAEGATSIADLRERNERLAQQVAQLVTERDRLATQVASLERPTFGSRVYRRIRSTAGRVVRRLG